MNLPSRHFALVVYLPLIGDQAGSALICAAGLLGFEFLQDELDYETRTHHSNLDTVDHLHGADLEQAAIIEAIFLWNTSERRVMMPRKPFPHPANEKKMSAPTPGLFPGATVDKQ